MRAVVAVIVLALVLTGCVPTRPVPPSATDEEIAALLEERIDRVWEGTGLEGTTDRPDVESDTAEAVSGVEFVDCMTANGFEDGWGMRESGLDLRLAPVGAGPLRDEHQLAFYECFARFPFLTFTTRGGVVTDDQTDFLWTYYSDNLVPCLALHGYPLELPPRADFSVADHLWSPYDLVVWADPEDRAEAELRCGEPFGGLDIGTEVVLFSP